MHYFHFYITTIKYINIIKGKIKLISKNSSNVFIFLATKKGVGLFCTSSPHHKMSSMHWVCSLCSGSTDILQYQQQLIFCNIMLSVSCGVWTKSIWRKSIDLKKTGTKSIQTKGIAYQDEVINIFISNIYYYVGTCISINTYLIVRNLHLKHFFNFVLLIYCSNLLDHTSKEF